jgi:hypothetical protein
MQKQCSVCRGQGLTRKSRLVRNPQWMGTSHSTEYYYDTCFGCAGSGINYMAVPPIEPVFPALTAPKNPNSSESPFFDGLAESIISFVKWIFK